MLKASLYLNISSYREKINGLKKMLGYVASFHCSVLSSVLEYFTIPRNSKKLKMMFSNSCKSFYKNFRSSINTGYFWLSAIMLSACGGGKKNEMSDIKIIGFPSEYIPPSSNYDYPQVTDPSFKILEPILDEPYWVTTLEMNDGTSVINKVLLEEDRSLLFSFPITAPDYIPVTILGYAPANSKMVEASKEIFSKLEEVLDIRIEESDSFYGFNNLAIAQSIQANSAGFSYFPNNYYQLGSDIFISKDYSNPLKLENELTNYDYEVLVHEIGHALGLKHPHEDDRNNISILNSYEDQTKFTAMSYNDSSDTFDGTFRVLDWMALTKLYGVNSKFKSGNDVYRFSDVSATFIIDGGGIDTIDAATSNKNIVIDLRSGVHNYEGFKSSFITDANQLTISHGTEVENVITGLGDDTIVGNHLNNLVISSSGDDKIFAGEGMDLIYPGLGSDIIDLSEDVQTEDRIVFEIVNTIKNTDLIYGFVQGLSGDIIDIKELNFLSLTQLPIVDVSNVPFGYIDNCLVRVFGNGLNNVEGLNSYFSDGGLFETFKLSSGAHALIITANSQDTGETQSIYSVQHSSGLTEVHQIADLVGNSLDIDSWSTENFIV